jgi:hypothetical protein
VVAISPAEMVEIIEPGEREWALILHVSSYIVFLFNYTDRLLPQYEMTKISISNQECAILEANI